MFPWSIWPAVMESHPTLGQRLDRIGGVLLILLGDPMFLQNLHFEQPRN